MLYHHGRASRAIQDEVEHEIYSMHKDSYTHEDGDHYPIQAYDDCNVDHECYGDHFNSDRIHHNHRSNNNDGDIGNNNIPIIESLQLTHSELTCDSAD